LRLHGLGTLLANYQRKRKEAPTRKGTQSLSVSPNMKIVKSVYFSGITDEQGEINVYIDSRDAHVSQGFWQLSLESMTVQLSTDVDFQKGITVKVSSTLATTYQKKANYIANVPATIDVLMFKGSANDTIQAISPRKKEWVSFKDGTEKSQLIFSKTSFKNKVLEETLLPNLQVFGILLITREG
jgi:hypothetical protein